MERANPDGALDGHKVFNCNSKVTLVNISSRATMAALSEQNEILASSDADDFSHSLGLLRSRVKPPQPEETSVDDLLATVKAALGDRVSEVRASRRLANSPACLVAAGQGPDLQVERLFGRQMRGGRPKPILELNVHHTLVRAVAKAQQASCQTDVDDLSALLFEQAQILDGDLPEDPAAFAARLNRLVVRGLATGNGS